MRNVVSNQFQKHTHTALHNPNVAIVSIVVQFYTILLNVLYVWCDSYKYTEYIACCALGLYLKPKVNRSQLHFVHIFVKDNEERASERDSFSMIIMIKKINVKRVQHKTQMCSVMQRHVSFKSNLNRNVTYLKCTRDFVLVNA